MKLPKYNDDEVNNFHPIFEFSFKPILLDNKFFFNNYELVHHRKINNGTIPDYMFQNKKNKKSVLICEIKRTKSAVFNYNFNEQVKGYAETLKNELEKPFYILTNLEIINLYKYSNEREKVIHQLIKPSPIKVADFSKETFKTFTNKLEKELKSIVKLIFDKKIPEWKFGLSELERKLQNNYQNPKEWNHIIAEALSGYVVGSLLEKEIPRNRKTINKLLIDFGFQAIVKKINYSINYDLFKNAIEAGKSFKDGSDFGFIIQSIIHQNYEKSKQGLITSTDDELSNLIAFLSKEILDRKLEHKDLIFDPSAGIGNLFTNLKNYHEDIQKKQLWANEIDYHFIDCLILRLNLVNINKNEGYAKITNSNIADLELNQFKNVKIVVSNPPFKRGANKENSEEKKLIAKSISKKINKNSKLNIGQLGVECMHLELCVEYSKDNTNFIFVFPSRYLMSLSSDTIYFREYLINNFGLEYVINYPHKNIFSDVAKNTVLLIGRKKSNKKKIKFVEINSDLENLNYAKLKKNLKDNISVDDISIREVSKKELIKNNSLGWKEYFYNKNFNNLILKSKIKLENLDKSSVFLPRGNAGNTGGSEFIFPNKSNKIGKEILKMSSKNFILGIKNSEMIPVTLNTKLFKYFAYNPKNNIKKNEKNYLIKIFEKYKNINQIQKKKVQYKKQKSNLELLKILEGTRIYNEGTILIPRATRRHGKIAFIEEEAVISTNFILIKSKKPENKFLIVSWFLSIYGQLQLEELSNNERGVRKTEINYIKNKFLLPKLDLIKKDFKNSIVNQIKKNLINPIDLNNPSISDNDILWSKVLFGDDYHKNLSNSFELLKSYIEIREP